MIKLKQVLSTEPARIWFPLYTEQLRLRALTEVILLCPAFSASSSSFQLTLHESISSDPFFTSCQAQLRFELKLFLYMWDEQKQYNQVLTKLNLLF